MIFIIVGVKIVETILFEFSESLETHLISNKKICLFFLKKLENKSLMILGAFRKLLKKKCFKYFTPATIVPVNSREIVFELKNTFI